MTRPKFLRFVYLQLLSLSSISTNKSVRSVTSLINQNRYFRDFKDLKLLSQEEAINVDQELFNEYKFRVDQLMELAGLSVATAIYKSGSFDEAYRPPSKVLIVCGPGNNGGDGLVVAKHLKLFGYEPMIYYPKQGKSELFSNLVQQCKMMDIEFLLDYNDTDRKWNQFKLIVDALFGFSYKPPLRPEYHPILEKMSSITSDNVELSQYLISIDIPSGWHVENGPPSPGTSTTDSTPKLQPDCLISLTSPKLCSRYFHGRFHWLGGRFVPKSLEEKYKLNLPKYEGAEQCVLLSRKEELNETRK